MRSLTAAVVVLCASMPAIADEPAFRVDRSFRSTAPGVTIGAVSGVATDAEGNLFAFHRGDPAHPVVVFDKSGRYVRSFGAGQFPSSHGLRMDAGGNLWATDVVNHTVTKLSPDGKVLLKLGETGVPGVDQRHFDKPTDVAFAANGDVYVSDGYGNSRVVKFDKNGVFQFAWGKKGKGEGEFDTPHQVRLDSKGEVYVADRENQRIQVFTPEGSFIRQIAHGVGIAPYGLFITPDDMLFVADGLKHEVLRLDRDGKVLSRWGGGGRESGKFLLPHGITVGRDGAVYVGEITGARVQKFEPAK